MVLCESGSGRVAYARTAFFLGGEYSVEGGAGGQDCCGRVERAGSARECRGGSEVSDGRGGADGVLERTGTEVGGVVLSGAGPCDDF